MLLHAPSIDAHVLLTHTLTHFEKLAPCCPTHFQIRPCQSPPFFSPVPSVVLVFSSTYAAIELGTFTFSLITSCSALVPVLARAQRSIFTSSSLRPLSYFSVHFPAVLFLAGSTYRRKRTVREDGTVRACKSLKVYYARRGMGMTTHFFCAGVREDIRWVRLISFVWRGCIVNEWNTQSPSS